jgi:hypothetical protein
MSKSELLVLARATAHVRKQKQKEERKKVLRMCVSKLQNIQDPELYLCKSVLINNTLRNIQLEHREAHRKAKIKREREERADEEESEAKKKCFTVEPQDEVENSFAEDIVVDHESNPLSNSYYDVSSYKTDTLDDVILGADATTENMTVMSHQDTEYTRHLWQGDSLDLSTSTLDISVITASIDAVVPVENEESTNTDSFDDTLSDSDETITSDSSVYDSSSSESESDTANRAHMDMEFSSQPCDTATYSYDTATQSCDTITNSYAIATHSYITATHPYDTATHPYDTATHSYHTTTHSCDTTTHSYDTATCLATQLALEIQS